MPSPTTPIGRVSFPEMFKPSKMEGAAGEPKYAITLLFDKETDLKTMKVAAHDAAKAKWRDKIPKDLKNPFRDGDEKDYDGYAGKTYVRFSSATRPGLVDSRKEEITEASNRFYAGCYARVSYTCYAYEKNGNRGVAFGLQNVQKTGDGDPFSSRTNADDDFDAVETTDDLSNADAMFA